MPLFHLHLLSYPGRPFYDYVDSVVVRAKSPAAARKLVADGVYDDGMDIRGDEGPDVWRDPSRSVCTQISSDGKEGLIIRSFRAG